MVKHKLLVIMLTAFMVASMASIYASPYNLVDEWGPLVRWENAGAVFSSTYEGYTSSLWSGYYLGTIADPNDSNTEDGLEKWVSRYLYNNDTGFDGDYFAKAETINSWHDGFLTVTPNADLQSGTWSVSLPQYALGFYAVKGGNEFALYFVDPSQTSGIWTVANLDANPAGIRPSISHFSASPYDTQGGFPPVPEPSTLLLLGSGVIGLGVWGRRKLQK